MARPRRFTHAMVVREIKLFHKRYGFNPGCVLLARIIGCSTNTIYGLLGCKSFRRESKRQLTNAAKYLLETRKAKNLTLNKLAALAGVSPSTISGIERGTILPIAETLGKICSVLSVSDSALREIHKEFEQERECRCEN